MKKKQTFVYSHYKRSLVVANTSICIAQFSDEVWYAYRATGRYPCLSFGPVEGRGTTPELAIKSLLEIEKKKKECMQ